MTGVTLVMGGDTRRDRQRRGAASEPRVTSRTSALRTARSGVVLHMVELHVEALLEPVGKSLERWVRAIDVRMADRAHGNIRRQ